MTSSWLRTSGSSTSASLAQVRTISGTGVPIWPAQAHVHSGLSEGSSCSTNAGGYVTLALNSVGTGLLYESPAAAIATADKCAITPTTALVAGTQ